MIHLKCTAVHYTFLNYGPLNMLLRFFRFLIYVYFNEPFVKNFMKIISFLNTISKIHSRCSMLQNIGMSNLLVLK